MGTNWDTDSGRGTPAANAASRKRETRPAARGAGEENEKPAAGMVRGGWTKVERGGRAGCPLGADPARRLLEASQRLAVEAGGIPQLAACEEGHVP